MIASLFFSNFSEQIGMLFSFAIFAIGFFFRPIGGVIFGHIGDKYGRKIALSISIVCMAVLTALIGLLPTYSQIGMAAPIFLTIIRILQGICIGGEGAGSAVFILEHCKDKRFGLYGSMVMASNVAGTLLAIIAGIAIEHYIGINEISWRYGFFLGSIMGVLGLLLRSNTEESPVFANIKNTKEIIKVPIKEVLQTKWRQIIILASFASLASSATYIIRGFFTTYFTEHLDLSINLGLKMVFVSLLSLVVALPVFGYLADRFGIKRYIYCILPIYIIFMQPVFGYLINDVAGNIFIFSMAIAILSASVAAPYYPFAIRFFAPELRYSGISLGWNLGNAFFGGTTPIFASLMVLNYGVIGPAYYLVLMAVIFLIISFCYRKTISLH
jgi:MHS family proline/betaine transporter-like MFS transporter